MHPIRLFFEVRDEYASRVGHGDMLEFCDTCYRVTAFEASGDGCITCLRCGEADEDSPYEMAKAHSSDHVGFSGASDAGR